MHWSARGHVWPVAGNLVGRNWRLREPRSRGERSAAALSSAGIQKNFGRMKTRREWNLESRKAGSGESLVWNVGAHLFTVADLAPGSSRGRERRLSSRRMGFRAFTAAGKPPLRRWSCTGHLIACHEEKLRLKRTRGSESRAPGRPLSRFPAFRFSRFIFCRRSATGQPSGFVPQPRLRLSGPALGAPRPTAAPPPGAPDLRPA